MPLLSTILPINSVPDFSTALILFFALAIGHALADFPLQGEFLSIGKNRNIPAPKLADGDESPKRLWIYLMSAHSLIHAGFVWMITGSALLGFFEFVLHWIIDALKCEGRTTFETDQLLHLLSKVLYIAILAMGWL
ncbi:MAG: DUF3307 domain-containing protein [Verrucomicrobiales bacterium]|nr:DUF3307 domain-containing protein [Verrucomicrobiales bacterium]